MTDTKDYHGSPYDRGAADSYYKRGRVPHKMIGKQVIPLQPDTEEWKDYHEGYDENERIGSHKQWGEHD